jgi:selenocysteine lyase/cysteine desulfurase
MGSIEAVQHDALCAETSQYGKPLVDLSSCRRLFPITSSNNVTYLNASFQLPMSTKVKEAIDQFSNLWLHEPLSKALWTQSASQTKEILADYLHVPHDSLAFTQDTTEALNLFQRGVKFLPGNNVVILDVEHPNNAYGWLALQEQGLEVRRIPTGSDTFADASVFEHYVDDRTVAVSISSVMFHSGQMNDVRSLCREFRPRGIHVLADLTQHVGFAPINLTEWGVSGAAFGCHKGLGCPAGLGVLYIDPAVLPTLRKTPAIVGAGSIANLSSDLIANSEVQYHPTVQRYEHLNKSMISLAALRASLDFQNQIGLENIEKHLRDLGRELSLACERLGVEIVGSTHTERRSPHSYILKLLHQDWADHFRQDGVYVSHYRCGARISFGLYNDVSDVKTLVNSIERGLKRGISAR